MHDEHAVHTTSWEIFASLSRQLQSKAYWQGAGSKKINWNQLASVWVSFFLRETIKPAYGTHFLTIFPACYTWHDAGGVQEMEEQLQKLHRYHHCIFEGSLP